MPPTHPPIPLLTSPLPFASPSQIRDNLVYNDDVRPVVDRLKTLCLALAATWALSAGLFANVASMKPIFNEYDPNFINQLNANDDLAEIAARKCENAALMPRLLHSLP